MELHIKERLLIPGLLPEQNTFMGYNLKKSILAKISISAQDKVDYKITENKEKQSIEWNVQKDQELPLNVDFTTEELGYLVKACESLSEQTLTDETWSVVDYIYNEAKQK